MRNPDQSSAPSVDVSNPRAPEGLHEHRSQERDVVARLGDFDSEYFQSLEGPNGWIALGQENCRNQQYFTVYGTDGEKIGIVGVYDTDEDEHIAHTVVDPKYRGRGLAAQFKLRLMDEINLPYLTLTISINNTTSLRAVEKLAGAYKVSDAHYESEFQKVKFRVERQTGNELLTPVERRQLGEVWSRVVLGDRVAIPDASAQSSEEFQRWLHTSLITEVDALMDDWKMTPSVASIERIHAAQASAERATAEEAYITECQAIFEQRMRTFRPASEHSTKWDSWPKAMRESGEFNCAGAVLIGVQLFEAAGIRQWIGNPVGHVMHIVELADGTMWYVDFLNRNIQKITPVRSEIAGVSTLVLHEQGIEYQYVLLHDLKEMPIIILGNIASMQHDAYETADASDDLDVRAAKSSVAHFPGLLDTIDLEPLSVKLGSSIHAAWYDPVMKKEAARVEALHVISDDPRLRAINMALRDDATREAFIRVAREDMRAIQKFLEGETTVYASSNTFVQQCMEIARNLVDEKTKPGTELHRELVGLFIRRLHQM